MPEVNRVWVDPPNGWMYGFPAIWDKTKFPTLEEFLKYKKYPTVHMELGLNYSRMWNIKEDE